MHVCERDRESERARLSVGLCVCFGMWEFTCAFLRVCVIFLYFFLRPAKMCQIYVALMLKSLEAPDLD